MAKNVLKAWKALNTATTEDKTDKIFVLESTRSVDQDFVLEQMVKKNPGMHRETMSASINLYHEVVSELTMNGYSVNTDLFRVVPQFRGAAEPTGWNPEKNSIYASFTQGKKLREAIKDTTVEILGDRQGAMYINGTQDAATRATNLTATPGRNFTVLGKAIKVAGTDPAVGITLTAAETGTVTKIASDMIVLNEPSRLILLLPSGLGDGEYTLSVTTQYGGGGTQLKVPRTATQTIYIGEAPSGGGNSGSGEGGGDGGNTGSDGDQGENPLG